MPVGRWCDGGRHMRDGNNDFYDHHHILFSQYSFLSVTMDPHFDCLSATKKNLSLRHDYLFVRHYADLSLHHHYHDHDCLSVTTRLERFVLNQESKDRQRLMELELSLINLAQNIQV
jgi:hypothetical protein